MDQNQWNNQNEQSEQSATDQQNDFYTQQPSGYDFTPPQKKATNGYAIASLILGVISIVLCSCSCLSIVTAILAIVFALLSRAGKPMDGKALGGMICGIVALVLVVVSVVFVLIFYAETNTEDYMQFYEDMQSDFYEDYDMEDGLSAPASSSLSDITQ